MLETIAGLCVVLGAIVLLRVVLVRFGPNALGTGSDRRIQILESRALGMKQHLHLVEVSGQRLLIGASDSGLQRLAELQKEPAEDVTVNDSSEHAAAVAVTRRPRLVPVLSAWLGVAPLVCLFFAVFMAAGDASAQQAISESNAAPTFSITVDGATAPDKLSDTLKIVLVLTAISIAPSILLMATCFTRILIVLALLRQAIGTATLPPNQVLVGLALMTTVYVMTPVGEAVYEDALAPYMEEQISGDDALALGIAPVRDFMLTHTREADLLLFVEMKGVDIPETSEEVSLSILMPAFMISEIRAAFEIGFMIYLPFLVVDLVIASMLISLGMIMLPPVMIALPFKLMLFVLVDGWNLTLTALVSGFL
ncbi:MAG: flagellar type III secretion system pore protein FliP [Myxococcota bacterium]